MYNANRGYYMAIIRYSLLCLLCMAGFNANADTQTPTTRITSNLNNLVAGSVTLSGNATDQGGSGVDRVFVSIRNNAGMFFYDGAFRSEDTVTFRHLNVANGTDQWSISLPLLPAGSYEVTARARDGARNQNPQVRDRRTVVVQPRNTTSSGGANSLVQGNTIRFPNNDYYQVQSADGTRNICEGERECDVADGTYLVINHTTGERIRGVVVGNGSGSNTSSGGSNTGSSSNSSSGMGGFTVSGNTIRFSNDDYYQVQTAGGTRTICEGERTCDVEDGTYIIINHTSGERYTDVVVNNGINAGKPEFEDITVSGNTILLSNSNFYYQVQSAGGTRTICEGEQSCEVPDGTYLVINHTTGERFGNIVVGNDELLASSFDPIVADSVITVTGNTISYPDNGYYQAQTADGSRSICEGERSCTVPDGEYVVINHTTGERLQAIVGGQTNNQSATLRIEDAPLLIRAATLSDFLMDEIVLTQFADSASSPTLAGIPNPFMNTRIPQSVSFTPDVIRADGTVMRVSGRTACNESGIVFDRGFFVLVTENSANGGTEQYYDRCEVDAFQLNGLVSFEFGDFEELDEFNDINLRDLNTIYNFQNFEVTDDSRAVTVNADNLIARREVLGFEIDPITADFLIEGVVQTYTVTDSTGSFALRDVDISQSRFSGNDATTSTFVVETLNGQTINAQGAITDVFRSSPDGEFLQSGVLVVTSGNSTLTIEANDQSTYLVTLERDGSVITEILPWSGTELPVPALALL